MSVSLSKRLSVVASALGAEVRSVPRLAQAAGFAGLLFDVKSPMLNLAELSETGRREFQHLLRSSEQTLVGLQMTLGPNGLTKAADIERQIMEIDRAMETAAALMTRVLCVELGAMPALAEAIIEIGKRADRYGVMIAFSSALAGFAKLKPMLSDARCQWLGIDLDPVAILQDEWNGDEVFSHMGEFIRHVRARDAVVGDRRIRSVVIGSGNVDWPTFLSQLEGAGYHGFITIDPNGLVDRARGALDGMKHLHGIAS